MDRQALAEGGGKGMFTTRLSDWTWQNIFIRMAISLALGIVIGIDRGAKRRGGGARTTITVCLGATMVMLLEQYLEEIYPELGGKW